MSTANVNFFREQRNGFKTTVCYRPQRLPMRGRTELNAMKINYIAVLIHPTKGHAKHTGAALKAVLDRERVRQHWVETLPPQRNLYRRLGDLRHLKPDLVIACGGD